MGIATFAFVFLYLAAPFRERVVLAIRILTFAVMASERARKVVALVSCQIMECTQGKLYSRGGEGGHDKDSELDEAHVCYSWCM
jgi:hypothetical protein